MLRVTLGITRSQRSLIYPRYAGNIIQTILCVFRVDEFSTKEFKRKVEKAKTCRELIQVLKVRMLLIDVIVAQIDRCNAINFTSFQTAKGGLVIYFCDSLSATRFKKPTAGYDFIHSRIKFKRRRNEKLRRAEFKSVGKVGKLFR